MDKPSVDNWNSYHPPGGFPFQRIKRNAIFISNHNTIKHEMAKALGALMLARFGDIKFNEKMLLALRTLEEEIEGLGFIKSPSDFITECVPNSDKTRRIDLVDLRTGTEFEFETNSKVKKEGAVTIYL